MTYHNETCGCAECRNYGQIFNPLAIHNQSCGCAACQNYPKTIPVAMNVRPVPNNDAEHLKQLAYVCSWLRKDRKSDKVIELTDNVLRDRPRYSAVDGFDRILCTRGAAFRDIGRPDEALKCALESIKISSVFCYAFNLAGAAYYNLGQFVAGDRQFAEARKRGADEIHIEGLKKRAKRQWEKNQANPTLPIPQDDQDGVLDTYGDDDEGRLGVDGDALREADLIKEELTELSDSFHRSGDDGWFYAEEE